MDTPYFVAKYRVSMLLLALSPPHVCTVLQSTLIGSILLIASTLSTYLVGIIPQKKKKRSYFKFGKLILSGEPTLKP